MKTNSKLTRFAIIAVLLISGAAGGWLHATSPGKTAGIGSLTVKSLSGAIRGSYPLNIPPGGHKAIFVFEAIASTGSGRAELTLTAGSLSITALRVHNSSLISAVAVGTSSITANFSPQGGARSRIISEISKAQTSIDIAIYSFTSDEISSALVAARNRGIAIRIIADTSQAVGVGSEIPRLEQLGFDVKRKNGGSGGIMHNKYMIVDGTTLFTGSYNWSANAEDNNFENAIFIQGSRVIQSYTTDFNRIWER